LPNYGEILVWDGRSWTLIRSANCSPKSFGHKSLKLKSAFFGHIFCAFWSHIRVSLLMDILLQYSFRLFLVLLKISSLCLLLLWNFLLCLLSPSMILLCLLLP
jgi:hypothetical protein